MSYNYVCPHCEGHIRANSKVILSAETETGSKGLVLLSPQVGNYEVITHAEFKMTEGETLKIFCPICHANLQSKKDKRLARINMYDEQGNEHLLFFSEIVGEHATYEVHSDGIKAYGEDKDHYMNHWGESFSSY